MRKPSVRASEQAADAPVGPASASASKRARLIASRAQAADWLRKTVLYFPQLDLGVPGRFVRRARQPIDPTLVSRIKASYQLAMPGFKGTGDSVWTSLSERSLDIHQALLKPDDEDLTHILEDPIRTSLFAGYYSVARDLQLDEDRREARELRRWAVHQTYECFLRLAEAMGSTLAWNPERLQAARDGGERLTGASLERLLEDVDHAIGVRVDFPNPIQREFGLPTKRGIASYRAPHAVYQAWRIRQLLEETGGTRVLEIGAGMGRTAYYATRLGGTEFTIVDLPLANVAQATFLGRVLGAEAIWLPGDPVSAQKGRIRIVPPEWFANTDEAFDVALNVDSITEMDFRHASAYVRQISRCAARFLSINHEANLFSTRALVAQHSAADTRSLRYPYWLRKGYVEETFCF